MKIRLPLLVLAAAMLSVAPAALSQESTPLLRPGDGLRVSVWPAVELSGEFFVEESGNVYLPYLGAVRATGISLEELRRELVAGYTRGMQNPVVSITPLIRIAVLGEVQRPGSYLITNTDQLFDVVGLAGGFTRVADQSKVRVVREGQVVELDALRALTTGDLLPIKALGMQSGDNIVVPQATEGIQLDTILLLITTVTGILLTVDRIIN